MDIYVTNLPFKLKDAELQQLFEQYGQVASVRIVIDKITRQSKGFGFVQMLNEQEGITAIKALNGFEIKERKLTVSISESKQGRAAKPEDTRGYFSREGYKNVGKKKNDGTKKLTYSAKTNQFYLKNN
jgi:heterogeneous nuclear ribonucleoprotein G